MAVLCRAVLCCATVRAASRNGLSPGAVHPGFNKRQEYKFLLYIAISVVATDHCCVCLGAEVPVKTDFGAPGCHTKSDELRNAFKAWYEKSVITFLVARLYRFELSYTLCVRTRADCVLHSPASDIISGIIPVSC
jgi:hypothetical protein